MIVPYPFFLTEWIKSSAEHPFEKLSETGVSNAPIANFAGVRRLKWAKSTVSVVCKAALQARMSLFGQFLHCLVNKGLWQS
jgi:hypothetical protein